MITHLEVWTGERTERHGDGVGWTYATEIFEVGVSGVVEILAAGQRDYWVNFANGEQHLFSRNSVRRVIYDRSRSA